MSAGLSASCWEGAARAALGWEARPFPHKAVPRTETLAHPPQTHLSRFYLVQNLGGKKGDVI